MIRLLASSAAAALLLAPVIVSLAGSATAEPAASPPPAAVRTASVQDIQPVAPVQAPAQAASQPACARAVRVVGIGYGEPVLPSCRAPAGSAQAAIRP